MTSEPASDDVIFKPIDQGERADALARFFVDNVDTPYISHGEVIDGRATDFEHWSPELAEVFGRDVRMAIANAKAPFADGLHLAGAYRGGELVALALYEYVAGWSSRTAILHDIVVAAPMRQQAVGTRMLAWLERQFGEAEGVRHIFLESGKSNHGAHAFFERHGYRQCSIVMTKQIRD